MGESGGGEVGGVRWGGAREGLGRGRPTVGSPWIPSLSLPARLSSLGMMGWPRSLQRVGAWLPPTIPPGYSCLTLGTCHPTLCFLSFMGAVCVAGFLPLTSSRKPPNSPWAGFFLPCLLLRTKRLEVCQGLGTPGTAPQTGPREPRGDSGTRSRRWLTMGLCMLSGDLNPVGK